MRRRIVTVALLGLLCAGASPSVAQEPRPTIVPAGAPKFPERAYLLTVPERRALTVDQLRVTENGVPVRELVLSSNSGTSERSFGTVLLIDTSKSMQGGPIRKAMEAARLFAKERTGNQKLGIILFNGRTRVLIAPTADQQAIEAALAPAPYLAPRTRIFDAVGQAIDLLAQAKIAAGSIVVMSDGADSGSVLSKASVISRARKANIRIFSVGLRSGSFDSEALSSLAAGGNGRYIPAESVSQFGRILRNLGAELASEYVISYRSTATPASEVTVAVRVEGYDALATSTYARPGGASFVYIEESFWTSTLGVLFTVLLFALLLVVALAILMVGRWRGPGVRERVRGFVSMPGDILARQELVQTGRVAPGATERSLERMKWWPQFRENIEIARIDARPVRIVVWTAIGTFVVFFLMSRLGSPLFGLIVSMIVPFSVRAWVNIKLDKQRRLFAEQLPDVLQGSASAIRAGHGLTGALAMVVDDSPEPSRTEFRRVVTDEQLGVPLDEALRVVQQRMDSRDVQQIALVAQIQRETGGNTAEVLDRVTEALRQRAELRRMVQALTAQGRLSRWVVTFLPVALLLIISALNPDYVAPLFNETAGQILLGVAGAMMLMGSLVIKKIVDFKV